jgi:ubiquinone/menaquinone biosynthesis C-methylase UbiE
LFPEKRIADADEQITKALALTNPAGKSVLDLCCGPGRCSIAFAKRGFRVTGIDRTTHLLNKARAKARAALVKIEWVQKDLRDFVRPSSFALVLSMFTSFGYFDDRQDDMTVLENMFTSPQPGGACLIIKGVAERVGFEPTVGFPLHSLSRRALSTAQTPLRCC